MSIPLVQKPEKDDINTSIIAIKRDIERINMLLGLVDSGSPDLSGFVKKSDIVDVVESGNNNPVTSNAVFDFVNVLATGYSILTITDATINTQCIILYRRITLHLIELKMLANTSDLVVPNTVTPIATLPEGFRPAYQFEANINGRLYGGGVSSPSKIIIRTDGVVNIVNFGGTQNINTPENTYFFSY